MAYSSTYSVDDLPVMAIDLVGRAIFAVIGFITLIVLIGVFAYLKKGGKKLSKW